MRRTVRAAGAAMMLAASVMVAACQSPTDPDDVVDYDEVVDVTVSPNPIVADTDTGGRTYRLVRGNNQPDDILPYDWHVVFSPVVTFNSQADDDDVDIQFPVKLSSTALVVKQASGGIVTPPTGSDTEHYEFVTLSASGNQFSAAGAGISMVIEAWYDLPSLRREAVITMTFTFVDDDGVAFQKVADLTVAP
ncbi:MAG: hypothetical protein AB7O67_02475 [Vicinamibacterales bacterium]